MRLVLAVTAAALLATPATARAAEGDIIVQREPGASAKEVRKDADVKLVGTLGIERTELVEPKDGDVAAALTELRADADVVSADVDRRVAASDAPNDFPWASLWGLNNTNDTDIDAPEAWLRSVGAGVTVGVVDTGVNFAHEDLQGQFADNPGEVAGNRIDDDHNGYVDDAQGWDFVTEDNVPQDGNGHGTHVAGTIAAVGANGTGLIGVAPSSKVLPLRALDNTGSGFMSDIAAAFDYAGDLGIRVVNASLGGGYASILGTVVASHPDTLYVVAAGNDKADNDNAATASYPCALPEPNVLCVGATDPTDSRAWFSNFGRTSVDLSAPGVAILSAWNSSANAYRLLNGTSMATPHAAGAAALALAATPTATTSQLKWALTSSVDVKSALATASATKGRLNADAAVAAISGQGPQAVPTPEPTATPAPTVPATATAAPVVTPVPTQTPHAPPVLVTPPPAADPIITTPVAAHAPSLFKVKVGGSLARRAGKLKVTYSLSDTAVVRFAVTAKGRSVTAWTHRSAKGANAVTLTRRLPNGKTLKAGAYTLSVGINASAKRSAAIRVR